MSLNLKTYTVSFFLLAVTTLAAQSRAKDTLDEQVVNVVKPYQPTIADAFKVKEIPVLNDSNTVRKKEVKYNIFSIPVASTFTPAKGKAANVEKQKTNSRGTLKGNVFWRYRDFYAILARFWAITRSEPP